MLGGCKEVPGERWPQCGVAWGEANGGDMLLWEDRALQGCHTTEVLEQAVMGITGG